MLKTRTGPRPLMLPMTNFQNSGHQRWCAALVSIAVCALAISVVTRYGGPCQSPVTSITSVRNHVSAEPGRQRLIKSVATWLPVVVCHAVLEAPSSYPPIAPVVPLLPGILLEQNLYNRPPPSDFLS